jgi:hypothetical protein
MRKSVLICIKSLNSSEVLYLQNSKEKTPTQIGLANVSLKAQTETFRLYYILLLHIEIAKVKFALFFRNIKTKKVHINKESMTSLMTGITSLFMINTL